MEKKATILNNDNFQSFLEEFQNVSKFWVAYSGGMDSSVLLHLFYTNKDKIKQGVEVIYVNHGLQDESDEWGKFCKQQSEKYNFPFTLLEISESCPKGESIEAWARDRRYNLMMKLMKENDVLFTGHHKDDQVETFFLQALRGAGPKGLAVMPEIRKKGNNIHARPLLNYSRDELKLYAKEHEINWRDDKSNADNRYDRNYFRHKIAPLIENRWPAYRDTLTRLISYQKETKLLLNELGLEDINDSKDDGESKLNINIIKKLTVARQKNLLFSWLEQLGLQTPGSRHIEKIIADIINSDIDKSPCVNWADVEIRRYKNYIYAFNTMQSIDVNSEFIWQPESILNLNGETLIAKHVNGIGISENKLNNRNLTVRFRKGGEKIKPHYSNHTKTVKQLFQDNSVLPWYRDKIPLIYINHELVVIPGFCVDKNYMAENDEPSWDIHWSGTNKAI